MATARGRRPAKAVGNARRAPARKAAPAPVKAAPAKAARDVTVYAEKEPTDYHKAYARWIVNEVGYDPNSATSKRAAFLAGVSIATAARPAFMESDFLAEWRESAGVAKRGPKPKGAEDEEETPRARKATRRQAEPEPEDDEEYEDDEFEDEDSDEEDSDDEFEDDDDDSDDDEDSEDEDFEDEDEEEPPARSRRAPAKKSAPARKTAAPAKRTAAKKAAPAKATRRAAKPADDDDDDDFIF